MRFGGKAKRLGAMLMILLLEAPYVMAAVDIEYVFTGGSGGDGETWTSAHTTLAAAEAAITRGGGDGGLIYVADGSVGGMTADVANSGTAIIEVRKATVADHGTSTGWVDTMGDGQAVIEEIILGSDYWTINGVVRNENDWDDGNAYGFRVTAVTASTAITSGVAAHTVILDYINAGGAEGSSYTGSEPNAAVKIAGFDELAQNWIIRRSYFHNIAHDAHLHINGVDGLLVEDCKLKNGWGKESIRGQIAFKNAILRRLEFENASMNSGEPGEGSTAEIAIWDGSANQFENIEIYRCTFFRNNSEENSGGTVVVGGNGGSWDGSPANNVKIYNLTIAGVEGGASGANILINGGTGNEVRNILWHDVVGTPSATPNTSNNGEEASDPFVNYASGNLRLSTEKAGFELGAPYNIDLDGEVDDDGTFSRGAYAFAAGVAGSGAGTVKTSVLRVGTIRVAP